MFYDDYKLGKYKFKKINILKLIKKYTKNYKYNMNIDEAKEILTENGYDLEPKELYNIIAYDIDVNNPICPCCGKRLKIINKNIETEEFIGESTNLNERWENEYLLNQVQDVANQLFDEELSDVQPEVDTNGDITNEYLERFIYNSPSLKKAITRAATKLSNDLAENGFKINPWYCEQEIYEALKGFAKNMK